MGKSTINALVGQPVAYPARPGQDPPRQRTASSRRRPAPYLVDLPGCHAGGGEKARREFAALTGQYFASRIAAPAQGGRPPSLAGIILAIDARHPGLDSDADAVRWAGKLGLPFLLVATKVDKLKQAERARLARGCEAAFGLPPLATSTQTGEGLDELWRVVREWTFLIPEP